jgi:hypothetical protein
VQGEDYVLKDNSVAMVTSTPKPSVRSLLNHKRESSNTQIQVREDFALTVCMICTGTFNLICIKPLIIHHCFGEKLLAGFLHKLLDPLVDAQS